MALYQTKQNKNRNQAFLEIERHDFKCLIFFFFLFFFHVKIISDQPRMAVEESRWIPLWLFYLRLKIKKKKSPCDVSSAIGSFSGCVSILLCPSRTLGAVALTNGILVLPLEQPSGEENRAGFNWIPWRAGAPSPSSALQMICHSLLSNTIIDYSFFRPTSPPFFFMEVPGMTLIISTIKFSLLPLWKCVVIDGRDYFL